MRWTTDIQANILRGLPATHAHYLFVTAADRVALQNLIKHVAPHVRDARWQANSVRKDDDFTDIAVNLAFTRAGVKLITGKDYQSDEQRRAKWENRTPPRQPSDAFAYRPDPDEILQPNPSASPQAGEPVNSMFRRLDVLREAQEFGAGTDHWEWDEYSEIHALVWFSGRSRQPIESRAATVKGLPGIAPSAGIPELQGENNPGRTDPFDFVDGSSQPAFHGFHSNSEIMGRGAWTRDGWRGLEPGELIVGQLDEGGERRQPTPVSVFQDSTFLVFRQIEMFRQELDNRVSWGNSSTGNDVEIVASEMVGRRRPLNGDEGSSIITDGPSDTPDFIYGFDPEGLRCPLGAHIRRAHPRDSMGKDGRRVNRHRIVRRGMPYWNHNQNGTPTEGLAFIALQARIEDQFEFVQAHWLNSGPTLHVGEDPDLIAGNVSHDVQLPRFVRQGSSASIVSMNRAAPVSVVRGGEYFVLPSLPALAELQNWPA